MALCVLLAATAVPASASRGDPALKVRKVSGKRTPAPDAATATAAAPAAAPDVRAADPVVTAVRIERVKPQRERYPTMQFLRANRDFIRSRIDLLRERNLPESGAAGAIDPRFLAYQRMIADATSSTDSLTRASDMSKRWELFANITDLGRLEDQLDLMDRQLADQKARLADLQRDFTGRQQTSLAVVLSGYPASGDVKDVTLVFEPGDTLDVPLSSETSESLRHGGVLELCHRLIEPREQLLSIALGGGHWDGSGAGYVTLDPARDQISFLRLDLSTAKPSEGASSMAASRWIHDTGLEASRGPETQP